YTGPVRSAARRTAVDRLRVVGPGAAQLADVRVVELGPGPARRLRLRVRHRPRGLASARSTEPAAASDQSDNPGLRLPADLPAARHLLLGDPAGSRPGRVPVRHPDPAARAAQPAAQSGGGGGHAGCWT